MRKVKIIIEKPNPLGRRCKCPICGKIFYVSGGDYAWAIRHKSYCSYTCFRVAEKAELERKHQKIEKQLKGL
ncbi:MAG: hypothetical protein RR458_06825 [Clostridia bacterium]